MKFPELIIEMASKIYYEGGYAYALHDALIEIGLIHTAEHFRISHPGLYVYGSRCCYLAGYICKDKQCINPLLTYLYGENLVEEISSYVIS